MIDQIVNQTVTPDTITNFQAWCDFITDELDQVPDNGDSQQALADDKDPCAPETVTSTIFITISVGDDNLLNVSGKIDLYPSHCNSWSHNQRRGNVEIMN